MEHVRLIAAALLLAGPGVLLALWGAGALRSEETRATAPGAAQLDSLRWLELPLLSAAVWILLFWWMRELPISWEAPIVAIASLSWLAAIFQLRKSRPPPIGLPIAMVLAAALGLTFLLARTVLVPPGVDAAMHAAMARVIADSHGHPTSYRPFWPLDFFHTYPVGQPTLVALLGAIAHAPLREAALLGHAGSYALVLCAFSIAVARASRKPLLGAVAGAVAIFCARSPLYYWSWGGAPSALGIAFALLAFTYALELAGEPRAQVTSLFFSSGIRSALATGTGPESRKRSIALCALFTAAGVLTHGVAPAAMIWTLLVLAIAFAIRTRPNDLRAPALRLAAAGLLSLFFCAPWLAHLRQVLGPDESQWIADNARHFSGGTFRGALQLLPAQLHDVPVILGAVAFAFLFWRDRSRAIFPAALTLILIALTLAGAHQWLPGSALLYPERLAALVLFPIAIAAAEAVDLALELPHARTFLALAGVALAVHAVVLQRKMLDAGLEHALVKPDDLTLFKELDKLPECTAATNYGDAGQWLPALLGRPITFPQIHVLWLDEVQLDAHPCAAFRGASQAYDTDLIGPLCADKSRCSLIAEQGRAQLFAITDPMLRIRTTGFSRPEMVATPNIGTPTK